MMRRVRLLDQRDLPRYLWERSGSRWLPTRQRFEPPERLANVVAWARTGSAPRVSICIPTRDRLDLLVPCLQSLARTSDAAAVEIVIGDTGSADETFAAYDRLGLRVVRVPGPFNFSRVCNAMAQAAVASRLLFLNSDTTAVTGGWVERLLRADDDQVLGACLVYPGTRRVQSAGIGAVRSRGLVQRSAYRPRGRPGPAALALQSHALGRRTDELPSTPSPVMAVSGAFLALTRERFEQLGGFDESYRVDLQDVDLCLRAWAGGAEVVCDRGIVFAHRHAATRGRYAFPGDDWERFVAQWRDDLVRWQSAAARLAVV